MHRQALVHFGRQKPLVRNRLRLITFSPIDSTIFWQTIKQRHKIGPCLQFIHAQEWGFCHSHACVLNVAPMACTHTCVIG